MLFYKKINFNDTELLYFFDSIDMRSRSKEEAYLIFKTARASAVNRKGSNDSCFDNYYDVLVYTRTIKP